jgi:hypothetical protein
METYGSLIKESLPKMRSKLSFDEFILLLISELEDVSFTKEDNKVVLL